jgi:hypothetical protein
MVENAGAFEHGSEVTVAPAARNILEAYHGTGNSSSSTKDSSQTTTPSRT